MNMKDKNGETASQRIARKFLTQTLTRKDCNTSQLNNVLTLYRTPIARLSPSENTVYILSNNATAYPTRLTASRIHAIALYARKLGMHVEGWERGKWK